jgi:lipid-A-disaccharide synthase
MAPVPTSILIVSGETSGDRHGAGLIRALRERLPKRDLAFFGSGGREMAEAGTELLFDVSRLSAIGPLAALTNLGNYVTLFRRLLDEARRRRPVLAILVDFPDFNLPLARRLKSIGIPVCYFIGPQLWAWRPSRMKQIQRYVDLMLVILPFEEEYYGARGVRAHYVGNPTARRFRPAGGGTRVGPASTPVVGFLPGSRRKEVDLILPIQLDAAAFLAGKMPVRFRLLRAPEIPVRRLRDVMDRWAGQGRKLPEMDVVDGSSEEFFGGLDGAVVKSGTSTLEAMLAEVPFAMVYRLAPLSWYLLRPLVRTRTYCLANLVAGVPIVPEFVQREARGERIGCYLEKILGDRFKWERIRSDLRRAGLRLGSLDAYTEGARRIAGGFFDERENTA